MRYEMPDSVDREYVKSMYHVDLKSNPVVIAKKDVRVVEGENWTSHRYDVTYYFIGKERVSDHDLYETYEQAYDYAVRCVLQEQEHANKEAEKATLVQRQCAMKLRALMTDFPSASPLMQEACQTSS